MSTCETCTRFDPHINPQFAHLGRCNLVLPPWLATLLDLHGNQPTRADDTCSFHQPPEVGDNEIDWEDIYGVGGQG